jgi:tight adherence protein C
MSAELFAFVAAAAGIAAAGALRPARRRRGPVVMPRAPGPRRLLVARTAGALAGGVAGLVAGTLLPGRLALLVAIGAPALGFLSPDLWLARRRAEQIAQVRRDMPALLDLLGVAVEAGLSLTGALAEVGRRSHAPLARAWGGIAAQVAVGVPVADALDAHRRELPIPEVESFTGALARAIRHGAPLGDTLAAQAREVRLARRRAIQEQAAKAGPKMQLVVALLLVPSVMLLVAAALVSALTDGGHATNMLTGY